jgi:hypothetical protein
VSDSLLTEYRKARRWNPDPGPTSRISVELPRPIVARLNKQARSSGISRRLIIETAVLALLSEWEQIDAEQEPGNARGNDADDA